MNTHTIRSVRQTKSDHERRLEQAAYIEHVVSVFRMGTWAWQHRAQQALKEAAVTIRNMQAEIDYLKRNV